MKSPSDKLNERTEDSNFDNSGSHDQNLNKEGIKVGAVFTSMMIGAIGFLQFGKF